MSTEKPIRIMIVEDHPVFREGLNMIIAAQPDMEMVAQASTADEALQEYRRFRPDVILMDQRLPGASGTDAVISIRNEFPQARIMMLTTSSGDIEIQRALRAGAAAYVLKSTPKNEILRIIRTVSTGRKHIPSDVASSVAEHMGQEDLTPRELEVLELIREGNKNKQIADQLSISETTSIFISRISSINCRQTIGPMQSRSRCAEVCSRSEQPSGGADFDAEACQSKTNLRGRARCYSKP